MAPHAKRWLALAALCASYLQARSALLKRAEKAGARIGPKSLGLLAWKFLYRFSQLVGVDLASEGGEGLQHLDPSKRYLIVWHPHGFLAWSAMFILSRFAVLGHPHGSEWFAMVAPVLFRIPIISEALMLVNGRGVDKRVVESYLSKGKSIALQPGGMKEQMASRHDQEQAIFPANLGFIRMALKYGMDLLPVYIFNENQTFKRMEGSDAVTKWIYDKTGFGVPMLTGRFGAPMAGLMPIDTEIHVRWGEPVEVGPPVPDPSEEQVEELFCRYLDALRSIWTRHAQECLPPEVAAKGLKIIRLDAKPVPPHRMGAQAAGLQPVPTWAQTPATDPSPSRPRPLEPRSRL
mmetsp:Transcript_31112/g.88863  ORF Transcript_31112/g.88863 Transcript_31112/m.88863 type:complete len:348 (+) Transcript_31112:72-1115(+)